MTDPGGFSPSASGFRTPEFAFVVACVAWPRSQDWSTRIVDLANRVEDWRLVMALINRHRVVSLTFDAFTQVVIPAPAEIRAGLASQARMETLQELRTARETVRLIGLIEAAAIDVIVVKGVTTALYAFGRLGLRYSMDIDLLVRPEDVSSTASLLRSAGYVRTEPAEDASSTVMVARMKRYKDVVFTHAETGTIIELHWRLFQNPTLLPAVEARCRVDIPGGGAVPTLEPSLALLYLCLHGAEHAWARLKWLADLAAVLGSDTALASRLYDDGRARGLRRLVGPGLTLSHQLFGSPMPEGLSTDLATDGRMRWLVASNRAALFGDEDGLELEEQKFATTRKNLGHYVASASPAYWYREFIYDVLDGSDDGGVLSRVGRLLLKVVSSLFVGRRAGDQAATSTHSKVLPGA